MHASLDSQFMKGLVREAPAGRPFGSNYMLIYEYIYIYIYNDKTFYNIYIYLYYLFVKLFIGLCFLKSS